MSVVVDFCQTPGKLWSDFIKLVVTYKSGLLPQYPSVSLSSFDGYRSIVVEWEPEVDPDTHQLVLTSLKSTDIAPARFFVDSPGFQGNSYNYVAPPDATLSDWDDFWSIVVVETKQAIINDWSDAAPADPTYSSVTGFAGNTMSSTAIIPMVTENESLVTVDQATWVMSSTGDWGLNIPLWSPTPSGAALNLTVANNTSPIVEAINQLAMSDFDIQFNHGQVIFSVRGRVNAG